MTTFLRPGQVVDGYEVLAVIGKGGMGAVYRVRRGGTDLALKTQELLDNVPEAVIRFEREAQLLASLEHPNVVRIHAFGRVGSASYFIMPLVEGEALDERIRRGPVPEAEAVPLALAIARAVQHAHERGIVHRDVKPANVLLEKATGTPFLADFGLARQTADRDRLTRTGEIIGTPNYLSPEQAIGIKEELDEKTDVYGLGATLYAALAGRPPFDGSSMVTVLKHVCTEEAPPLPDVSPAVDAVVRRAMAKRREDRTPDAATFIRELEAAAATRETSPRLIRMAGGLGLLALLSVVAAAFALRRPLAPRPEPPSRATLARDKVLAVAAALGSSSRTAPALFQEALEADRGAAIAQVLSCCEAWLERASGREALQLLGMTAGTTTRDPELTRWQEAAQLVIDVGGAPPERVAAYRTLRRAGDPPARPLVFACAAAYRAALEPETPARLEQLWAEKVPCPVELRPAVAQAWLRVCAQKYDEWRRRKSAVSDAMSDLHGTIRRLKIILTPLGRALSYDATVSYPASLARVFAFAMAGAQIARETQQNQDLWDEAFADCPGHPTFLFATFMLEHAFDSPALRTEATQRQALAVGQGFIRALAAQPIDELLTNTGVRDGAHAITIRVLTGESPGDPRIAREHRRLVEVLAPLARSQQALEVLAALRRRAGDETGYAEALAASKLAERIEIRTD